MQRAREDGTVIRIAIVEDDKNYQDQLVQYIHRYTKETGRETSIRLFSDGDMIIDNYAGNYDMIFLDIEMKRMNGMDAARMIRKMDEQVILIFITNIAQYAIQGYEVSALDYVLKPVEYFAFSQEMDKATARLKMQESNYLTIQQEQGIVRLDTREIKYLEKYGHHILVHSEKETYSFRETMKAAVKKIQDKHFVQCNSGYLVNLRYVESVRQNIVVVGGDELQISRPKRKEFMEALTNYLGGK